MKHKGSTLVLGELYFELASPTYIPQIVGIKKPE